MIIQDELIKELAKQPNENLAKMILEMQIKMEQIYSENKELKKLIDFMAETNGILTGENEQLYKENKALWNEINKLECCYSPHRLGINQ